MAFRHGVYKSEVPTSLISPVQGEAGLPVVVGTSPIYMGDISNVNNPVLCYSYAEAVQSMGFLHRDWDKWTLSEFIYSQFALFGQSPVVLINVFDPDKHKTEVTDEMITIPTSKEVNLGEDVIISKGFTFRDSTDPQTLSLTYTASYNVSGEAVLAFTGTYPDTVRVSYTKAATTTAITDEVITIPGSKVVNLGDDVMIAKGFTFKSNPQDGEPETLTLSYTGEYNASKEAVITFSGDDLPETVKVSYTKSATTTSITGESATITGGSMNLGEDVLTAEGFTFTEDTDGTLELEHSADYDDDGNAILTFMGDNLPASVKISYTKANPDAVTAADIIGGYNAATGKYKGLELVSRVYPKYQLIPGIIAAPKWSENASVAAVMKAKCENINGLFTCISVVDIPSDDSGAVVYSAVTEWKNLNNYVSERQIACWPKVKLGDDVFHMSTQLVGLMNSVDRSHDDLPYKSPSNESFQMNGCINAAGDEISLGLEEANYLNSQGVVTALNFSGGWKCWGNRTSIYPSNTDVKDCFIPVRRMFDFIGNTFITTFWQKTDEPMTPRLIRTIVNSFNVYLNGMAAREQLLGGRIEFLEDENPTTDLLDGTIKFHIYMSPPVPAETIEGIFEFDPDYFNVLISALS